MPPDVREWLPKGHLAWFVIDASQRRTCRRSIAPTGITSRCNASPAAGSPRSSDPTRAGAREPARAGEGGHYEFLRRVLASERGAALYGKRQPMIEPVFGDMKFNRGMDASTDAAEPPSGPNGG